MEPISLVAVGGGIGLIILLRRHKKRTNSIRISREAKERAAKRTAKRNLERDWAHTTPAREMHHDTNFGRLDTSALAGLEVKEMGNMYDPRHRVSFSNEENRVLEALLNNADLTKIDVDDINFDFTRTAGYKS